MISPTQATFILIGYITLMLSLVFLGTKSEHTEEEYLLKSRKLGVFSGALSMAVSWIWAPAIFFCGMKAYLEGMPGIFWFTVPNILCFATFAFVAIRMRKIAPDVFSMPGYIATRFPGAASAHLTGTVITLLIGAEAVIFNSLVGSVLLNSVAGIPLTVGVLVISGTALTYSIWRGFPASVVTDVAQMIFILALCFILVPWAVTEAGGISAITAGLGGVTGRHTSIFETEIAFAWGIPATITLFCFPFSDQMFYQRAFAAKGNKIWKVFILGGLIFGIVPILLSLLGFLGANPAVQEIISTRTPNSDPLMINVNVIGAILPEWSMIGFVTMAICALSSTLDSGYCAISSVLIRDVYNRHINIGATAEKSIRFGQIGTCAIGICSALLVIFVPLKAEWIMLIGGTITSALAVPLVLSVFWTQMTGKALFLATVIPLVFGLPLAVYGNVMAIPSLTVSTMIGVLLLSTLVSYIASRWCD